jgi:hypothetical protein
MTQKNELSKIRDYDRHKSRACVDLFVEVADYLNSIIRANKKNNIFVFIFKSPWRDVNSSQRNGKSPRRDS